MKARVSKVFQVKDPISKVWSELTKPEEIVTCLPGAKLVEKVDDKNYKGEVLLKFGPIKAEYEGFVTFIEMDQENYLMVLSGKGSDSKGKGSADVRMDVRLMEKEGGTEVKITKEVSVMGVLAQFGSMLIDEVTEHVLNEFISNFKDKLKGRAVDNTMNAGSMMGSVMKKKISGFFGGGDKNDA